MISRFGLRLSRLLRSSVPDPFVIAIVLTLLAITLALLFGDFAAPADRSRIVTLLDAWRDGDAGLWRFLAFGMQMCLILVTGHALAVSRPVRRIIARLADLPRGTGSAALMVSAVACLLGLVNWGLGLVLGALLTRASGRSLASRGIRAHYPLLAASGYSTMMLWHGGLSGTAPLTMTTTDNALKVLDPALVERLAAYQVSQRSAGGLEAPGASTLLPLSETIGSALNVWVSGGLLVIVPLLLMLLAPKRAEDMQPICASALSPRGEPDTPGVEGSGRAESPGQAQSFAERLNHSPVLAWTLGVALLASLWRFAVDSGISDLGLNQINAAMFALGLILHGSPKRYMTAVGEGASGCAGIIIQFPLYGGIMGIMVASGLITTLAEFFMRSGSVTTIPLMSFLAAGVVNLFVPSGGGQWAIQGPVALEAALAAGIEPGRMVMAVAFGDQMTNMLQPFWALPLLAITGVRARDIVGYTCIVMLVGALWMAAGLLLF